MRQGVIWQGVGAGLCAGLLLGLSGPGYSQAGPLKVGVINLKDVFDNYQKVKVFTQKLAEEGKAVGQEIELLQQELRQLQEKIEGLKNVENKTKEDYELQFLQDKTKLDYLVKVNQDRFSRRLAERTSDFYNEIRKAVEDIAKAEGYDLVFKIDAPEIESDKSESLITQRINHRPLLYARADLDFTPKVVKVLNDAWARAGAGGQGTGGAAIPPLSGGAGPNPKPPSGGPSVPPPPAETAPK